MNERLLAVAESTYESTVAYAQKGLAVADAHPDLGLIGVAGGVVLYWQDIGPSFIAVLLILAGGGIYAMGNGGGGE